MPKKQSKTKKILKSVGKELKENPPKVLAKTKAKKGAKQAEKQRVAILLSKAKKKGAKVKFNKTKFENTKKKVFNLK